MTRIFLITMPDGNDLVKAENDKLDQFTILTIYLNRHYQFPEEQYFTLMVPIKEVSRDLFSFNDLANMELIDFDENPCCQY